VAVERAAQVGEALVVGGAEGVAADQDAGGRRRGAPAS
jgi:hypothetical protein